MDMISNHLPSQMSTLSSTKRSALYHQFFRSVSAEFQVRENFDCQSVAACEPLRLFVPMPVMFTDEQGLLQKKEKFNRNFVKSLLLDLQAIRYVHVRSDKRRVVDILATRPKQLPPPWLSMNLMRV